MGIANVVVVGAGAVLLGITMGGCGSTQRGSAGGTARHVAPASADAKAGLLGTVERLAGTWESYDDEKKEWYPHGTFTPGSGGTAVREVMMPGTPHEMTNMYTMDGASLCMTHYCAMGNQPRMRCTSAVKKPDGSVSLPFAPEGVTDLNAPDEPYMGKMTLTLHADGTASQEWWQIKQGKVTGEHHMVFKMRRKG
jgi:hypothetical protein